MAQKKAPKDVPPLQYSYFSGAAGGVVSRLGPPKAAEEKQIGLLKGAGVWDYSPNGAYLAGCTADSVIVHSSSDLSLLAKIPAHKPSKIHFSPRSRYVCVWGRSQLKADKTRDPNFVVYDMQRKTILAKWVVLNVTNWPVLQWSTDETIAVRLVNSALKIFPGDELQTHAVDIGLERLKSFSVGKGKKDKRIAAFVPEHKSTPAVVKIFAVSVTDGKWACVEEASKTFFRAQDVSYYWNSKSSSLLVRAQTDVDARGRSYYGESRIYYLRPKEKQTTDINIKGVIHMVDWEPSGDFFAVAHGDMPHVNVTIYHRNGSINKKMNLTSARNYVKFSPCGRLLLVGAFGSLSGDVSIYDWRVPRLVGACQAYCTSFVEWSPDSMYFLCGILSPRMRVDNGVKIFKRDGTLLYNLPIEKLYKIGWRPALPGVYPKGLLDMAAIAPNDKKAQGAKKSVYRPPSARSGGGSSRNSNTGGQRFIPGSSRSGGRTIPGGQKVERSIPGGQKVERSIPGSQKVERSIPGGQKVERSIPGGQKVTNKTRQIPGATPAGGNNRGRGRGRR